MKVRQCQKQLLSGEQCKRLATMGGYCGQHFNPTLVELKIMEGEDDDTA